MDLPPIYPILDAGGVVRAEDVPSALDAVLHGGARIIQLRGKTLGDRDMLELARVARVRTRAAGAKLIINDRADIALLSGADGVHLGQDDVPFESVRAWLPMSMVIGLSCHDAAQVDAAPDSVDYLGFGPVFETSSKANPDPTVGLAALKAVCEQTRLPIVAIGGITIDDVGAVLRAGASSVAMISALFGAPEVSERVRMAAQSALD